MTTLHGCAIRGRIGTGDREPERDPYRQLAAAILHRALWDWRAVQLGLPLRNHKEALHLEGYGDTLQDARDELVDFFDSDWLDRLCSECEIETEHYLAALRQEPEGGAWQDGRFYLKRGELYEED